MIRIEFLLFFLLTSPISGSLSATGFGTTAFRKPQPILTRAPLKTETICPLKTILIDGKCVFEAPLCERGKTWSSVENKCICLEKDAEYNKDLLLCTKGGVWAPTFDKKVPENAFSLSSSTSLKFHPVKVLEEGNVVIRKFNSKYGVVSYDDESAHIGNNYDEIFTSTELKIRENVTSKVSGNYLTFRVKGNREITVMLVSPKQCFAISIAVITNHFIGIYDCMEQFSSTVYVKEGLLSTTDSRGFWVFWNSSSILMGLEGDLQPRIQLKADKIYPFSAVRYLSGEKVEWQVPVF